MTVIISFIAALRAGDLAARAIAVWLIFASLFAFAAVQLYRHDQRVIATHKAKSEAEFNRLKNKAEAAVQKIDECRGNWNREKHKCE